MGDDSEWLKLPTEDKCTHKAWKARIAGYAEAKKLFELQDDPKSPEFSRYLGLIKKFVTDSNAIAQEKALDTVIAFLENAGTAGKTAGEVCGGVVTKCLNSNRARTKEKGMEILMLYIEIEKQEVVQEELLTKGLTNKQPKVVAACVQTLRQSLRDFGPKVIQLKPIVKQMQRLLEDRDKIVREEGKLLVVEIYHWIGAALRPQLSSLKPVQMSELEVEFEKLPSSKPTQTRFLRSQQDLKAKHEAKESGGGGEAEDDEDGSGDAAVEIDPFEIMTAVEILTKLPKDFYDKLESAKWQERRESLDACLKLLDAPKLEQGDYHDLVKAMKKVVTKDKNVILVGLAVKCMTGLANGLRKKFSSYSTLCIEALLEKFKEKKPATVAVLREAVDAVFLTTTLEAISESIVASLEHKTPSVVVETITFLARCFAKCTPATLPKKLLKMFVVPLLKTTSHPVLEVREASFVAIGTAMKVIGEKPLMPFIADVDSIKMAKIKDCCEKAAGKVASSKSAEPSKKAEPAAAQAKGKPKITKGDDSKPKAASGAPSGGAKVVKTQGGKKRAPAAGGGAKAKKTTPEEVTEHILGDEAIEEQTATHLPGDTVENLSSSNWKDRLAAMEKFTEVVSLLDRKDICTQAFVRTITKKPGLKETNFQVMKLKVDLLATLALKGTFTRTSSGFCLMELVDKVGDPKNGAAAMEALSCIAEGISLNYIGGEVMRYAFVQRNPKNQAKSLDWLAQAIKEFGFKIEPKPVIAAAKKALETSNPVVRGAGMNLLGVLYLYMGPQLRMFFENEKPALLLQIDAIFEKLVDEKPPAPMRGAKVATQSEYDTEGGGAGGDGDDDDGDSGADTFNVADLVPRTDISDQINEALLSDLKNKNWKIRNEGLQKVVSILNDAKFITPNIGDLPVALHARLTDSNKNLIMQTINICQTLATAMGPNIRQHTKTLASGVVACLGDSKPHIRKAALTALNVWVAQSGLLPFVEADIFSDELRKENPFLRAELLGFLAEQLPNCKKLPPELDTCVVLLLTCLEDRNADVRKKAQEALLPFMVHLGYQKMMRKAGALKTSSKDHVVSLLEKTRDNLPQKAPPATARAAPAATKSAAPPKPVSVAVDVEEDVRPSTAPARTTVAKGKAKAGTAAAKKQAPAASKKDKEEPTDDAPPMKMSNGKEQRLKDEKNLKVLKWNFTVPRIEFVEQLHTQMEPSFSASLLELLFHANFKMHIKAYDILFKARTSHPAETTANLDVILKWLTLRFFDTNTSILLKGLEYIRELFTMLTGDEYHLHDNEANSFIPYLINKVGDPKDNVRRDVRTILKLICKVYPASKMFSFTIDGLRSKNSKQRTECLEELGSLIEIYGITVCQPSPAQALKLIAQQIGDRDKSVRSAALNTIVAAYLILGEGVYKYIGNLIDKDQSMLEERIKRSMKNGPPAAPPAEEKAKVTKSAPNARSAPESRGPLKLQPVASSEHKPQLLDMSDNPSLKLDVEMPKLIEHDLQDLLYEPVQMPVTRSRPVSHNMKLLSSSDDAKSAIDLVLSQIASNVINTSIQALAQVDEVLKDNAKCQLLSSHVDQFLVVTSLQLRMAYSKYMSDSDTPDEVVIQLYRCLLGSLLELFQKKSLVKEGSKDVLKDLMQNLVTILLDSRLNNLEDGPQLVRTINLFLVKVVEKADCTSVMSALIKLLHESVASETCSSTFIEIIMKCLWRMVRNLPGIIDTLDVDCILSDLHQFLVTFPSHTWRHRPSDVPLRTVKTILHSLAKLKGNKILSNLSLIDSPHSEVESYLQKVISSGIENSVTSTNAKNEQMNNVENGNVENRSARKEATKSQRLSSTTHEMLKEIFKKIGLKENTREGLNDLYDFKLHYPEADLEPFLNKSSPIFQNYIQRGLKNIEAERVHTTTTATTTTGGMKTSLSAPTMAPSASGETGDCDSDMNYYMERLNVLRSRLNNTKPDHLPTSATMPSVASAGDLSSETFNMAYHKDRLKALRERAGANMADNDVAAPTSVDASSTSSSSSLSSESSATVATTIPSSQKTSGEDTTAYVADLKKRLDRIKNSTRH